MARCCLTRRLVDEIGRQPEHEGGRFIVPPAGSGQVEQSRGGAVADVDGEEEGRRRHWRKAALILSKKPSPGS